MLLAEKIAKYKTVNRGRCPACANPWYFDMHIKYECTTCGREEFADVKAANEAAEQERIARRKAERDLEDERRRKSDSDSLTGLAIGLAAEAIVDSFSSPSSDSGSTPDWSGGGGDFSGGGASGDW